MTCYHPQLVCYSKREFKKTGKKNLHFDVLQGELSSNEIKKNAARQVNQKHYPSIEYEYIKIPCGRCIGCKSDKAKEWSVRCIQEAMMHKFNSFITLTYDDRCDIVEEDPSCVWDLRYKHFQNFMKRLRKRFPNDRIRFIVSGEYGSQSGRAHFHAILFGFWFPDVDFDKPVYINKGYRHYSSKILAELWPHGFVDLTQVDYGVCSYVSQYVLKKATGVSEPVTVDIKGELFDLREFRTPEFVRMSNRRGIGYQWYEKYGQDCVLNQEFLLKKVDKVIKCRPPRYYEKLFDEVDHEKMESIKLERTEKMKEYYEKNNITLEKLKSWLDSHLYRIKQKLSKSI